MNHLVSSGISTPRSSSNRNLNDRLVRTWKLSRHNESKKQELAEQNRGNREKNKFQHPRSRRLKEKQNCKLRQVYREYVDQVINKTAA